MALTWDATAVEGFKEFPDEYWPVTQVIVFSTITVGINHITEKNAAEFYARCNFYEKGCGPLLSHCDGPQNLTPEDIKKHIGLHTNASAKTRAQFYKTFNYDLDAAVRNF